VDISGSSQAKVATVLGGVAHDEPAPSQTPGLERKSHNAHL
jgi:hypothetical protein